MSEQKPSCAKCEIPTKEQYCRGPKGKAPAFCSSVKYKKLGEEVFQTMSPEDREFARQAAIQEGAGYNLSSGDYSSFQPVKPRIVEIVEFARRMHYKKIGLIFCGGVRREAGIVGQILETNGFEVVSFMCKVGRVPKSALGVKPEEQLEVNESHETVCNPQLQAAMANEENVDFAVMMGLCVGHDSLVIKSLKAPVTVFAVKDRLLGHNPMAAIYLYDSYYRYLKHPLP